MNWVFETYSNVYNTAMMNDVKPATKAPVAKKGKGTSALARLFGRA